MIGTAITMTVGGFVVRLALVVLATLQPKPEENPTLPDTTPPVTVDPSELPWSLERLSGLAHALGAELEQEGVVVDDPIVIATVRALTRFVARRASMLTSMDLIEALMNNFGDATLDEHGCVLGPVDSALSDHDERLLALHRSVESSVRGSQDRA